MEALLVVDCELRAGRGYVVLGDAREFDLVVDGCGLHIRSGSGEITDPAMQAAVRRQLVRERLIDA